MGLLLCLRHLKIACKVVRVHNISLPLCKACVWNLSSFSPGEGVDHKYSCLGHQGPGGDPLRPLASAQRSQCFTLMLSGCLEFTSFLVKTLSAGFDIHFSSLIPVPKGINFLKLVLGCEILMFVS